MIFTINSRIDTILMWKPKRNKFPYLPHSINGRFRNFFQFKNKWIDEQNRNFFFLRSVCKSKIRIHHFYFIFHSNWYHFIIFGFQFQYNLYSSFFFNFIFFFCFSFEIVWEIFLSLNCSELLFICKSKDSQFAVWILCSWNCSSKCEK